MRRSATTVSRHICSSPSSSSSPSQASQRSWAWATPYSPTPLCSNSRSKPSSHHRLENKSRHFSTTLPRKFTTTPFRPRAESISRETHYEFFPDTLPQGPPPNGRFHIDLRQLRNEFLQLQAKAHPDRHPGGMKARAEALSSRINEAYKTLKEPLARAQYVLALNGVDVEDEAGKVEDMELLALVMEAREEIEDAQSEKELQGLRKENEERLQGSVERLAGLLEEGEWDMARAEAVKLRYWANVKESIEAWKPGEGVPNLIH